MIVKKRWKTKKWGGKPKHYYWGLFLFGIIPIYIERIGYSD